MNWRDYLKDFCIICQREILWKERYDTPDLNYYGLVLKAVEPRRFLHQYCIPKTVYEE